MTHDPKNSPFQNISNKQAIGSVNTTDFTTRVVIWDTDSTFRELSQPEGFISVSPKDVNNRSESVGHTLTTDPKAE